MDRATKPGKVPEEEIIDLSAGFVLKNTSARCELAPERLTPDSFMAQHAKSVATPNVGLTFDSFMAQQSPSEIKGDEAGWIDEKPISWCWCTQADMPALQRLNFEAEIASGEPIFLPERPSTWRVIAVAERDGKVLGGILTEDSVVVSLIGIDPPVLESAGEWLAQIVVAQARKEKTRFLFTSLPAASTANLDRAALKAGFTRMEGRSYKLDTGIEMEEQNEMRTKPQ